MKGVLAAIVVMTCVVWCAGARAQVYRCTTAGGSVAYQDRPCARGQRQAIMDVPSRAPPGDVPPSAATVATPPVADASTSSPAAYVPPPSPLPVMYACIGAVNRNRYLTRSPPPPYLAPLGAMGWPPQTLSRAYGAPGGAGLSAPELSKPRIGGPRIAAGMVEVEDACAPAPQVEVCDFVQREYNDNHRKLRMAVLPREQKPLRQREQELQDQLRNCR